MKTNLCRLFVSAMTCLGLVCLARLSASAADDYDSEGISVELAILTGRGALPAELQTSRSLSLGSATEALHNVSALRKTHPDKDIKVECLRLRGPFGRRMFVQTSQPFAIPVAEGGTQEGFVDVGHILEIQAQPGDPQFKIHLRYTRSERVDSVSVNVKGHEVPGLRTHAMGAFLFVKANETRVIERLAETKDEAGVVEHGWRAMLLSARNVELKPFRDQTQDRTLPPALPSSPRGGSGVSMSGVGRGFGGRDPHLCGDSDRGTALEPNPAKPTSKA